jgi:hypothetical protein
MRIKTTLLPLWPYRRTACGAQKPQRARGYRLSAVCCLACYLIWWARHLPLAAVPQLVLEGAGVITQHTNLLQRGCVHRDTGSTRKWYAWVAVSAPNTVVDVCICPQLLTCMCVL